MNTAQLEDFVSTVNQRVQGIALSEGYTIHTIIDELEHALEYAHELLEDDNE